MSALAVIVLLERETSNSTGQAAAAATRFGQEWEARDWPAMYRMLSPASRRSVSFAAFKRSYASAAVTSTETSVQTGPPVPVGPIDVLLPVRVGTRAFGSIEGMTDLSAVPGGHGTDSIAWRHRDIFPGLGAGQRLHSNLVEPPRAAILAADGTPVSASANGVFTLGSAGEEIAGVLGAPSSSERAKGELTAGVSGLERLYDSRLAGKPGGRLYAGRRLLASGRARGTAPLRTTIDPLLQRAAAAALGSRDGGVAVIRPSDGAVLALSGLALSAAQPPGSTFKIVTTAAALKAGLTSPGRSYPVRTSATLDGYVLHNANGEACGGSLSEAFAVSCNSVFAPLGAQVGASRLVEAARRFGFDGHPRLPDALRSTIPGRGDLGNSLMVGSTSIGQGQVLATPLEMASVAATIANRGVRARPHLLASLPTITRRATSSHIASQIRSLMLGVVEHGTGTAAAIPGMPIAGKTGTAELRNQSESATLGTHPQDTDAWFVAFPADHPSVAVAVMLVGAGYGGQAAAPIARSVLLAALGR
ncbi:MAG TPA: penicillin-binding transpeptidase domain-containing protein [Solirubrobacterales bacterium]|nr:penicillin-binding transpeptidase domain-containing protein [Solirubrobacterales bacterium]